MRSREEFGRYLLLKKLTEDPLGETFRAGVTGTEGLEQVVLLRVFNGRSLDGAALWRRVSGRGAVQKGLKSPNIGSGVDLGEVRGVPYAAYEYISGKNLETLLIQASNTNSPIPADHALLIAERAALALSAASETRVGDERIVHGFAIPHLVMISNEGETRVLGFEVAPGLAAQAGGFGREITRYLAPELVASGKADRSDDAYTLGAILFELLACKPLPEAGTDGYGPLIAGTHVAYDGTPLPPAIASLLTRSLAPRGERLADAGAWHKALSQRMAEAGHAATTFNLAFFMHNLFRDEIEAESREIERERAMPAPAAAGPAGAAAAAAAGRKSSAAMPAAAAPAATAGPAAERTGPSKALVAALAAAALVVVLAGVGWWALKGRGGTEQAAAEPAAQTLPDPAEEAAPVPQGPTPEEIQAQLAAMIDTRSEEMAEQLRDQYDQRIRELQKQLEQAEAEAARREQERIAARQRAEEAAAAEPEPAPAPQTADAQPASGQDRPGGADGAAETRTAAAETTPATTGGTTGGAASQVAGAATKPPAGSTEPPKPEPAEAKKTEPPKPQPVEPKTRRGDLVGLVDGVKPPALVEEPRSRYPAMAKKLAKEADVEVRVLVDETGRVREAELVGKKKAGFGFDDAALDAARSARYKPAMKDGVEVKIYVNLTIRFRL